MTAADKTSWNGRLIGVQPRIRLTRSFDQRSHTYQGYVLRVHGAVGGESTSGTRAGDGTARRPSATARSRAASTRPTRRARCPRKGMSWEEEDWVDEDAVRHRGPDD